MKNKYIDIYKTVYPIHLVVANESVTLEELKKDYLYSDKTELTDDIVDCICSTSKVYNKKTKRYYMLIKYNGPSEYTDIEKMPDLISTISHESLHALLDIYEYIGATIENNNQEPASYEIGYISECICKTLMKK